LSQHNAFFQNKILGLIDQMRHR